MGWPENVIFIIFRGIITASRTDVTPRCKGSIFASVWAHDITEMIVYGIEAHTPYTISSLLMQKTSGFVTFVVKDKNNVKSEN